MLAKKELVLLEALIKAEGSYLSSLSLAKCIKATDRTARKYLQQLMATVAQHGGQIVSKQGHGYRLTIQDEQLFEGFWQDALAAKKALTDIRQLEATEDRQRYILQKLFFNQQSLNLDQLLSELFISKTTLSADLNRIKQSLEPYGLTLNQESKQLAIDGDEQAIRRFVMAYFIDDGFENSLLATVGPSFMSGVDFSTLMLIVLEECRRGQLRLSDFVVHNVVLHLALMLQRIKLGYPLSWFAIDDSIQDSDAYQVALRIVQSLEQEFEVTLPPEEANYLALHLTMKGSGRDDGQLATEEGLQHSLMSALERLGRLCHCDLSKDRLLVQGLMAHFTPFLMRLENGIQLSNPLLEDITTRYPDYLALTKQVFQALPDLQDKQVSEDEWAYVALHVIAAMERQTSQNTKRALVVCATGYGSALMLKSRLESEFGASLDIVDVVSYYEISEERLRDVDVIISSLTLPSHLFLRPVINVSVFLTAADVDNIRAQLGNHVGGQLGTPIRPLDTAQALSCLSLLSPEHFLVVTEPLSREQLLDKMVALLADRQLVQGRELFRQQLDLREGYGSVVYGDCLAFPHPVKPLTATEEVFVAICPQPVFWDDKHPSINFVFLLSPAKQRSELLKHLSPLLVAFVADKALQENLLKAPSYQHLLTMFETLLQSQTEE